MSLTGVGSKSIRRKDVAEQKSIALGLKQLVMAHKSTLGDTSINLSSLVTPTEMSSLGFTNPTSAEILAANLKFYRNNLRIVSSHKGILMDYLSYDVTSSSQINFTGFTAEDGEIFVITFEDAPKTGVTMVDAAALNSTGTLAVGVTDYNVGTPFEVNKYPTSQVGAVLVFRNGQIQFRNPSNGTSGGNYQEVVAGGGLGTIIRFNNAPVGIDDNILVVSNGLLAYKPDGSVLAEVENLAGQLDRVIPTVAALAGVPETDFQSAPNNVDLKAFGDRVLTLENKDIPYTTDWVIFTPTGAWNTNVTYAGRWRRVGDTLEMAAQVLLSGAPNAANLTINLPGGLIIDTSKMPSLLGPLGQVDIDDAGVGSYQGTVRYSSATSVVAFVGNASGTYVSNSSITQTAPITFGSGDSVNVNFKVPIAGWTATAKLKDL